MKKTLLLLTSLSIFLFLSTTAVGQTHNIYVSDAGNFTSGPWQIAKFDENGENYEKFIGEELAWPQDILFLEDQNIVLISNLSSNKINRHHADTGDYIDDFATGISGPTRMKIGADSLLYVLQWSGNGLVKRYQLDGTYVDDFTNVGVTQSIGLDWDSEGNLYVSSYGGSSVRKFNSDGEDQGIYINSNLQGPTNIWFDDSGHLFANNWNGSTNNEFGPGGSYIGPFLTGLSNPEGVDFFPNGNILIGNGGTSAVKLFEPDGTFIEDIIPSGAGDLLVPNAVVLREITTVSTSAIEQATDFIRPTIGTIFYTNPSTDQVIASIEIFNMSGTLITNKKITSTEIWDARHYPAGMYSITARMKDGTIATQKIMVKQ